MAIELESALSLLINRLVVHAQHDDDLRICLRDVAIAVLDATDRVESAGDSTAVEAAAITQPENDFQIKPEVVERESPVEAISIEPAVPITQLPELTLGRPSIQPSRSMAYSDFDTRTSDLAVCEARCRLKAEAARWAASRSRQLMEGVDFYTEIQPVDRDLISRAKELPDCFLWMCHPSGPSASDPGQYNEVASCLENVSDSIALVRRILDATGVRPGEFEEALDLLAEALSALRVSIESMDGRPDSDQLELFNWLRSTASERQILIRRFMRLDDPADPSQSEDLANRIGDADTRFQELQERLRRRRKLLGKVRHKASLVAANPGQADEHWAGLLTTVEELVAEGLPPSNRDLREMLMPIIDDMPDQLKIPDGFCLVLREIDRFLSNNPPVESPVPAELTGEVQEVAKLLSGKSVVLIGGNRRPAAAKALKETFGLAELYWIETREHESTTVFESYVARPDVAVVLLAIRWSSHSYGDVDTFCRNHGKPFVRLPGGYSPNQVAAQIMSQCSERLK